MAGIIRICNSADKVILRKRTMTVQKCLTNFNWDDIRYFLALVDCGTVTATATRLGVNHVTVSRRIDRLEETLNRVLFTRGKDGYVVTLEGKELCRQLTTVSETFEQISQGVVRNELDQRIVRLSTLHILAEGFVTPAMAELRLDHPSIKVEIDVSTRNVSIARKEADIAIRLGLAEKGEFLSRRIGSIQYKLYGNVEMIEQYQRDSPVPTISFGADFGHLPEAQYIYHHCGIESIAVRSNSADVQRLAAINGLGIALLPEFMARGTSLVGVDPEEHVEREVWMLVRNSSSDFQSVEIVKEKLVSFFRQNRF